MVPENLQNTLQRLHSKKDVNLPHPLPIAHTAPAILFEAIVKEGRLKPSKCAIFGDRRLYLYYGGAYYRSSVEPTKDKGKLPVAFLFDPAKLSRINCCFPFDTGAVEANKCGPHWQKKLNPINRFQVDPVWGCRTPSVLVKELYANNQEYLSGHVDSACIQNGSLFQLLYEFLSADLTEHGADQRQSIIECHYTNPLDLKPQAGLIWIGYPNVLHPLFQKLCDMSFPSVPKPYAYTYRTPFRPSDMEAILEEAAREEIERYVE